MSLIKFTVFVANVLKSLISCGQIPPIAKLARWLEKLSDFDFNIAHIKGSTNYVADALSRQSWPDPHSTAAQAAEVDCIPVPAVSVRPEAPPPSGGRCGVIHHQQHSRNCVIQTLRLSAQAHNYISVVANYHTPYSHDITFTGIT